MRKFTVAVASSSNKSNSTGLHRAVGELCALQQRRKLHKCTRSDFFFLCDCICVRACLTCARGGRLVAFAFFFD